MGRRQYLYATSLLALLILCVRLNAQSISPASGPASPRQPAEGAQPGPVLRVNTRLVVVDVVALDKNEQPVADLKESDFSVLEDNKPQQVRVFGFKHPAEPSQPLSLKLAANQFTNSPSYRANSSFNVIVLDALNTAFEDQAYAQAEVRNFIGKMPLEQPVALYEFAGEKTRLLQDFTTDAALLEAGVGKFKSQISLLRGNDPPAIAETKRAFRVQYTVGALSVFAQELANYPGRKNLIWISGAFPFTSNFGFADLGGLGLDQRTFGEALIKAADALMNNQVAIYPVDAHGLETPGVFNAQRQGQPGGRALAAGLAAEDTARANRQITMNDLAGRTGGRSFYNGNDLAAAIHKSIDDGSTYYTLGYYPQNKDWNGGFRKIRVRASRTGITLRYRLGYYAVAPPKGPEGAPAMGDLNFSQALNLEQPTSPSLVFKADVLPRSAQMQNKVPVVFAIDPHAIHFERQEGGLEQASVTCGARAYSEKGKPLALQLTTMQASLKPETFQKIMQTNFPCQVLIDLPSGHYQLRLGVADKNTGLMGTTNAQVTVP